MTRPDSVLLRYYTLVSVLSGPFFPFVFLPLYFKYVTLEYRFDEAGISMKWGVLFRKEINLTYRRIQDIHLTKNILQRWLGLATVAIQTASGSAGPEMSIEGILQSDQLRDYLYTKMRGARGESEESQTHETDAVDLAGQSLMVLKQIRDLLQPPAVKARQ
jgi:putative membrane protein